VSFCDKASIEALNGPQDFPESVGRRVRPARRYITDRLNKMPGVSCLLRRRVLRLPELLRVLREETPAGKVIDAPPPVGVPAR